MKINLHRIGGLIKELRTVDHVAQLMSRVKTFARAYPEFWEFVKMMENNHGLSLKLFQKQVIRTPPGKTEIVDEWTLNFSSVHGRIEKMELAQAVYDAVTSDGREALSALLRGTLGAKITNVRLRKLNPAANAAISHVVPGANSLMLAGVYNPKKHDVEGWHASLKYDGIRCVCVTKNNRRVFYSREGKELPAQHALAAQVHNLAIPDTLILDGELVSGTWNQTISRARLGGDMTFYVFDAFNPMDNTEPFSVRWKRLKEVFSVADDSTKGLRLARCVGIVNSGDRDQTVTKLNQRAAALKGEGLVLKNPSGLYEFKRSSNWLKVKTFQTRDAEILEVVEGMGKFAGTTGALQVRDTKTGTVFNVGSGFSDAERKKFWSARTSMTGKIIEYVCDSCGVGTFAVRFPTFKRLRFEEKPV